MSYSGMAVGGSQMLKGMVGLGKGLYHAGEAVVDTISGDFGEAALDIGEAGLDLASGAVNLAAGAAETAVEAAEVVYETVAATGERVVNGVKVAGNIIDIFA